VAVNDELFGVNIGAGLVSANLKLIEAQPSLYLG